MTRFLSSVLFVFVFCAMLPACKLSEAEIDEILGLNDPGEPANLTVEQLIKHMEAATDPEGNFKNAKSYILRQVIAANPAQVQQFKEGKTAVLQYLVGQLMKLSRGKANPKLAIQMFQEKLK